jgi:periodic tryptophan protein 2
VDTFQIHIWSLKTGRLLDILAGHQGPVTSLCFSPESSLLASGSWDKTVRLWWGLHKLNPVDPEHLKAVGFNP